MRLRQGSEAYKQRELLVVAARAYKAEGHSHDEVAEKFGKSTAWSNTWCKGISPQGMRPVKHLRNQYTNDECDRVALAVKQINKFNPNWEYAGGFTSCDGRVDIRCKKCGTVSNFSLITIRHRHCVCKACASAEANKKASAALYKKVLRAQIIDSHAFNKGKQLSMTFCQACGALVDNSRTYCESCASAREKKFSNIKKSQRRIQACTKYSGNITAKALFERDGGICWICGQPCDINADINDNAYPSVDHLLPISLGGKDEWSNVKLAHRICNSLRGNKI